jgi:hypothetical protein
MINLGILSIGSLSSTSGIHSGLNLLVGHDSKQKNNIGAATYGPNNVLMANNSPVFDPDLIDQPNNQLV